MSGASGSGRSVLQSSGRRKSRTFSIGFLAPALILYAVFFIYPTLDAFRISLYDWTGFSLRTATYVGLANFREAIVYDKWFRLAAVNNVWIMVGGGLLMFAFALYSARALTARKIGGRALYKTLIFLPYVINVVGVALLWGFILQPRFGLLNSALRLVGLPNLAKVWLGSRGLAMAWIIFIIVWRSVGFYMVWFIAGMEGVPSEMHDAARVDGANEAQLFFRITLPLMRDVLAIALVNWGIAALRVFGVVWVLTGGAPANTTHTVATYMMQHVQPRGGIAAFRTGYGTALAVLLFIAVFALSLVFFRLRGKESIEY